jgi:hypothetical protein
VLVAVISMGVMEMVPDEVVDVIAVRHALVTAVVGVCVLGVVLFAAMIRRTVLGMRRVDLDHVLIDVIAVRVMQMAVVQVVDVVAVLDGGVPAARPVLMGMLGVNLMVAHGHKCAGIEGV